MVTDRSLLLLLPGCNGMWAAAANEVGSKSCKRSGNGRCGRIRVRVGISGCDPMLVLKLVFGGRTTLGLLGTPGGCSDSRSWRHALVRSRLDPVGARSRAQRVAASAWE